MFAAVRAGRRQRAASLLPCVGQDFFPTVDAGQFRLHVRAPAGTRLEETERYFSQVENGDPRDHSRATRSSWCIDNIGLPNRSYSLAFGDSATTGMADGEILVALEAPPLASRRPDYIAELRRELPQRFPELTFYFQPADIVSQILNFGLPAPIDIQIAGIEPQEELRDGDARSPSDIKQIPGVADVHLHQVMNVPEAAHRGRPDAGPAARADAAGRGQQRAGVAVRQRPGAAELLGRSEQRHLVPGRDAHADLQASTASTPSTRMPLTAHARPGRRSCWRTSPRSSAASTPEVVNHPTSSRSTTSTPTSRAATSAAWPARSTSVLAEYRGQAGAGQHDHDARPGGEHASRRSCGWAWASSSPRCWSTC